jgi:hypothetical protein
MKKILVALALFLSPGHAQANPTYRMTGEVDDTMSDNIVQFLNENPGPVTITIVSPGGIIMSGEVIEEAIIEHGRSYLPSFWDCRVNGNEYF